MTPSTCTQPVSWLRFEQYHLGELDESERTAIASHLAECATCAECLERIQADDLAAGVAAAPPALPIARARSNVSALRFGPVIWILAAAAAALLFVRGRDLAPGASLDEGARIKGTEVTFSLLRENGFRVDEANATYRDGDVFEVLVTCPPAMHAGWDLVVYERGTAYFPLPTADLVCGNDARLPGAFRISGHDRETICVVWNEGGPVDREAVRSMPSATIPRGRCMTLESAVPPHD